MTERQALKLSGLHDEVRKKALDMGFTAEQVETALIVTGGKTFKAVVDFLLKVPPPHLSRRRARRRDASTAQTHLDHKRRIASVLGTVLTRVAVRVAIPFASSIGIALCLVPCALRLRRYLAS